METPPSLNVTPLNAPHKDLDYLPLADRDFQIKYLIIDKNHMRVFCQGRDNYLNGFDILGLWEYNLPMYFLPSVHVFPKMIRHCHANYDPDRQAVMSSIQTVIFPITSESINEMLYFHPSQALTPLSMGGLLEKSTKLSQEELNLLCQTFMSPKHQLDGPPPYMQTFLIDMGQLIIDMISLIMGFNNSEFVDESTLVMLSMFTLR